MAYTVEQFVEQQKKAGKAALDKDINAIKNSYKTKISNTENEYDAAIDEAKIGYEDLYRENEVQKYINEKKIAENMANMGLTDSGLNRTQQTAVQLSYANQKNKLDTDKQKAINDISFELAKKVASYKSDMETDIATTESTYQQNWQNNAMDLYNEQEKNRVELEKAKIDAALKQAEIDAASKQAEEEKYEHYKYSGKDEKNKYQFYIDGKIQKFDEGINPYTGSKVSGYNIAKKAGYGFWNGYQPKGVIYNNKAIGAITKQATQYKFLYQGHEKRIWQTDSYVEVDGKKINTWIWNDDGYYDPVMLSNNGKNIEILV